MEAFLRTGTFIEIGTDASPWGMGGWLTIGGQFKHYFVWPISPEDFALFGVETGTAEGQQIWECLAVLVALDLWAHLERDSRSYCRFAGTTSQR